MLAKMIDKIVSLKETKIFEIDGQTYTDAALTRIPPHVDRPYVDRVDAYQNRTYKIHGRALLNLAAVLDELEPLPELRQ